jgi:hypothetical protein
LTDAFDIYGKKTRENGSVFTDFSSAIVRLLHAKYNSNINYWE